jgi:hypothetical protein
MPRITSIGIHHVAVAHHMNVKPRTNGRICSSTGECGAAATGIAWRYVIANVANNVANVYPTSAASMSSKLSAPSTMVNRLAHAPARRTSRRVTARRRHRHRRQP